MWARAAEAGAEPDDDGSLILARTVSAEGRSRAHLGGRSVPVGVVAELSEGLLAVHGQTDQLRLSRPAEQRGPWTATPAPTTWRCSSATARRTARWRELAADLDRRPRPGPGARPAGRRPAARSGGDRAGRPRAG